MINVSSHIYVKKITSSVSNRIAYLTTYKAFKKYAIDYMNTKIWISTVTIRFFTF